LLGSEDPIDSLNDAVSFWKGLFNNANWSEKVSS